MESRSQLERRLAYVLRTYGSGRGIALGVKNVLLVVESFQEVVFA